MPAAAGGRPVNDRPLSALPSVRARAAAFAAILAAGACGALIGYGFVGIQCKGTCTTGKGLGLLVGGALAAAGVAVIAILTLRAMGEWHSIKEAAAADDQSDGSLPDEAGPAGG